LTLPLDWITRFDATARQEKYVDLNRVAQHFPELACAPRVIQIIAENIVRNSAGGAVDQVARLIERRGEIPFSPHRVIMQDAAGLPALLDIAGLRDAAAERGMPASAVDLACPAHLIIDHSIRTDRTGRGAAGANLETEYRENSERFGFLRWAAQAFPNLTVIPPGNGIIHQINLEQLATVTVCSRGWICPDTVVGTDSHTPMINGLGVLGWGLGGVEASAVMLGETIDLPPPQVVGVRLEGRPSPGVLMTDVVLRLTERLRKEGVIDCFLEFFGPGVRELSVPDRATLSNMTPEYGATCSLFPVDATTLGYLGGTGRANEAALTAQYLDCQPLMSLDGDARRYDRTIRFDLSAVRATVAGPSLPHQALNLTEVATTVPQGAANSTGLEDGDVVIAAITSCTNTSNPAAIVAAGLLARNALRQGLQLAPHIKASFSPGSRAVPKYLDKLGLLAPLEDLGFGMAGFGCMTCVGNSGELDEATTRAIRDHALNVAAVLSGNRNFEGRVHPSVRSNYLASPPLVVAYALAGTVRIDIGTDVIATAGDKDIRLQDLWPSPAEIAEHLSLITTEAFSAEASADARWEALAVVPGPRFAWSDDSTYLVRPVIHPVSPGPIALKSARPLLVLGNSVTTDHISPVGRIVPDSPAGRYLAGLRIAARDFNTYGGRRGNATVMRYGTFANPRLKNALAGGREGWFTRLTPDGKIMTIAEAADHYAAENIPLVIVAGEDYGTGSARDWAAKGTAALGVRAVLARSFERIHRTNLALVGVLPLEWNNRPELTGDEAFEIAISPDLVTPGTTLPLTVSRGGEAVGRYDVTCRLDTAAEVKSWLNGGFLAGRLRQI
jgi:aconitate hydratase